MTGRSMVGIGRFVNIAHRGASGHAPENTVEAGERAVAMGADFIELDVRRTSDGELVAFHDASLDRTTSGSGPFAGQSLTELRALDAGSWFNRESPERAETAFGGMDIATLDELAATLGERVGLYIEAKDAASQPGIEADLVAALVRLGLVARGRVVLQAFDPASLRRYAELVPDVPRVQLLEYVLDERGRLQEHQGLTPGSDRMQPRDFARLAERAHGIGPNPVSGGRPVIGPVFIEQAHAAGLFVHAWTVDDPALMRRLMEWSVDGIFTNHPDGLARLVNADVSRGGDND